MIPANWLIESHAFSRTTVSSTTAKFSSGPSKRCANCGPPMYSTNPVPSSSASARSTSSSSSSDSCKNGMSSSRERSGPSASAIVEMRWIELRRSVTSSDLSSSIKIAIGYNCSSASMLDEPTFKYDQSSPRAADRDGPKAFPPSLDGNVT